MNISWSITYLSIIEKIILMVVCHHSVLAQQEGKKEDSFFGDHALIASTLLSPFRIALPCCRCHTVVLIALLPYDREGTCLITLAQILVVPIRDPNECYSEASVGLFYISLASPFSLISHRY